MKITKISEELKSLVKKENATDKKKISSVLSKIVNDESFSSFNSVQLRTSKFGKGQEPEKATVTITLTLENKEQ